MDLIIELIIFTCISFPISLLGVIVYKGNVELIAGYDPKKVVDKNGLAKWVGSHLILMGLFTLMFPILKYYISIPIFGLFILGLVILCVSAAIGCKQFEKK